MAIAGIASAALSLGSSLLSGRAGRKADKKAEKERRKAFLAAQEANERRYKQLLNLYQDLRSRNMAALDADTKQSEADLKMSYGNALAGGIQDLVGRGMSGTTLLPNLRSGIAGRYGDSLNRLRDLAMQRRMAMDTAATDRLGGVIEGRTDAYPAELAPTSRGGLPLQEILGLGSNLWSSLRGWWGARGTAAAGGGGSGLTLDDFAGQFRGIRAR